LAPWWLRQKIIWQKAALPYLFRLSDARRTVRPPVAAEVQALINGIAPPGGTPRQVVVGGPIRSGRTDFACGIGTEFAFKAATVRYLSFSHLLEFVASKPNPPYADDTGPWNLIYWEWSRAQVIIIDDVGPVIAAQAPNPILQLELFNTLLQIRLRPIAHVLTACHTVWVIGDLTGSGQTAVKGSTLNDFALAITGFCGTKLPTPQPPIVVELK
jgi:hypothetical protein